MNDVPQGQTAPIIYEPSNMPSIANHYGIVNPNGSSTPDRKWVMLYRIDEQVASTTTTYTQGNSWTYNVNTEYYEFTQQQSPAADGVYYLYDGDGYLIGYDDTAGKFIRYAVDVDGNPETFDVYNDTRFQFTYHNANNITWNGNGERIVVDARATADGHVQGSLVLIGSTSNYWDFQSAAPAHKIRWNASNQCYLTGGGNAITYYTAEKKSGQIEKTDDYRKTYIDFANQTTEPYDHLLPLSQDVSDALSNIANNYDITPVSGAAYVFDLKAKTDGTGAPDLTELTDDGWTVSFTKTAGAMDYNIASALAAKGLTPAKDDNNQPIADTYEFTLITSNYTQTLDLSGVVPVGWSYEFTEVGENNFTQIGNTYKPDWEFVRKSKNAKETYFDGDESVTFTNRLSYRKLTVKKQTVDGKAGTFTYRIKIWEPPANEGDPPTTYLDLSSKGATQVLDEDNQPITGLYEFTLTVPAGSTEAVSKTFSNIPVGYEYEVQELVEGRWEIVEIAGRTDTTYTLSGGTKYKVEIEDLDLTDVNSVDVIEPKDINVYYKHAVETLASGVEDIREVIPVDTADANLLAQYFTTSQSALESGKIAVKSPQLTSGSYAITGKRTAAGATVVDNDDGNTHESGNLSATVSSETDSLYIIDLTGYAPDSITVNGHAADSPTNGASSQDHFQTETIDGKTYMRLRARGTVNGVQYYYGKTNEFTSENHEVSYSDVIVYTYKEAAELPDGTKKDVTITLNNIKISVPSNASSMDYRFKGAIFESSGGPALAAYILGTATPSEYTVTEDITVKVDGATADQQIKLYLDGVEQTTTGNASTGVKFTGSVSGDASAATLKSITAQGSATTVKTIYTTVPYTITVDTVVPRSDRNITLNKNGTQDDDSDDYYIVELAAGQTLTIPDGKTYKIYEWDEENNNWEKKADSADSTWTVTKNDTYKGALNDKDATLGYTNRLLPIVVEKTWDDDSDAAGFRPNALTITVNTKDTSDAAHAYSSTNLANDKITKSGNKWTYTFDNIPDNETVTSVVEAVPAEYTQVAAPAFNNTTKKYEVTNRLNKYDLTISKKTTGNQGSRDQYFKFKIDISGIGSTVLMLDMTDATTLFTGDGTQKPNSATLYTKNMILTGTDGGTGNNGNTRDDIPQYYGDVKDDAAVAHEFVWIYSDEEYEWNGGDDCWHKDGEPYYGAPPDDAENAAGGAGQQIKPAPGQVTVYVYLQHGESAVIKGIPESASYTVSEVVESASGYTIITGITGDTETGDTATVAGGDIQKGSGISSVSDTYLKANTEVAFENRRGGVVPTEIFFNWKAWLLLLAAAAAYGAYRLRIRRREAEE